MGKRSTAELVGAKPDDDAFRRLPRAPIFVVCDNIRSLENVGLIFRLSDAARVGHLYLCGITGYPPLPHDDPRPPYVAERAGRQIAKTAIRTVEYVPWSYHADVAALVAELKNGGTQIVVLEQAGESIDYTKAACRLPLCLVLGHERDGVADEVLALADLVVEVPMRGMGNSLNVAMAYGVVVYELLRLRAFFGT